MSGLELKRGRDWGRESAAKLDRIMTFMTNHRAFKRLKRPRESFGNRFRQRKIVSISIAMFSHSAMPTALTFLSGEELLLPCSFPLHLFKARSPLRNCLSFDDEVQFFPSRVEKEDRFTHFPARSSVASQLGRVARERSARRVTARAAGRRPNTS